MKKKMWREKTKSKNIRKTKEEVYYVSNFIESAEEMGRIVRGHRHIENKSHYVKDASLEEDKSRIRKNPEIMAILRSMALNILRKNEVKYLSLRSKRKRIY
ncbi:MAG: hypothetical protein LBG52_06430 [Candidatus Peribacteria bacterium]|nr:hypothetical protein [Candidatus Peribacteria bacterium]